MLKYNNGIKFILNNYIKSSSTTHKFGNIYGFRNYCKGVDNGNIFEAGKGDLSNVYNIDGYSESGFSVNKVLIPGSINITPSQVFLWDVHRVEDIKIETLATLEVVEPAVEFLLIGTGATNVKLPDSLVSEISKRYKVNVECMTSINAIGTYNILAEEDRRVAAFIIPHVPIPEIKEPYLVSKFEYQDKNILDNAPGARMVDPNLTLYRKKQILLKMKLDESDSKSISQIEREIEKLEKSIKSTLSPESTIEQSQLEAKKRFDKMFIPTRNIEPGYVSTNQSQGEKHENEQQQMKKQANPFEKHSITDKLIIWFVKTFGGGNKKK